jgi:iron complex outermembrane receptor protein
MALLAGMTPLEGCLAEMFGNVRCDTRTPATGMGPGLIQELWETQQTKSTAVFAQADWTFAEAWTLTAGIRYTYEEKDFIAGQAYLAPVQNSFSRNFPAVADLDNDWDDVSPKLGLTYRMSDDIMFYGSYSEGFHSGGFFGVNQNVADFERDQYDPEFSKNWELGMKSQFFDNRLQLNLAYFYNDFEDKQEQSVQFDATTNTVATVFSNAASVIYQGIEAEAQWVATDYLRRFASFGWLDAEYVDFETDINPIDYAIGGAMIEDASFLTPRNAPEYTYGVGGDLTIPVGPGFIEAFAKYSYIDDVETNLLNLQVGHVDSREDLSASVGYSYRNFQLTVFGRNLTDEVFEVPFLIAPLFASGTVTPGRSWGVELTAEF